MHRKQLKMKNENYVKTLKCKHENILEDKKEGIGDMKIVSDRREKKFKINCCYFDQKIFFQKIFAINILIFFNP